MNAKIKNYLGIALIIGVLAVGFAVLSHARTFEPTSYRNFTVRAEGSATAVPDIARFTFGVITEGGLNEIEKIRDDNVKKANAVIEYLKDEGVKKEDIKTLSFNVTPKYNNIRCFTGPCLPREIIGYTVSQTVQVKVRDMDKAGELLTGVVDNGANNVSGLTFEIDDITETQNEARKEAFDKARKQAKAMAKAGGFRVGKLISVTEGFTGGVRFMTAEASSVGGRGGGEIAQIEPGEQEVRVNITMMYEIK